MPRWPQMQWTSQQAQEHGMTWRSIGLSTTCSPHGHKSLFSTIISQTNKSFCGGWSECMMADISCLQGHVVIPLIFVWSSCSYSMAFLASCVQVQHCCPFDAGSMKLMLRMSKWPPCYSKERQTSYEHIQDFVVFHLIFCSVLDIQNCSDR